MSNEIKIKISVDGETRSIKIAKSEFKGLGKEVAKVTKETDVFKNAMDKTVHSFQAIGLGFMGARYIYENSIGKMVKTVDALNSSFGRLKLATKGADELNQAWNELAKIANSSRVSFNQSIDLYTKLAISLESLQPSSFIAFTNVVLRFSFACKNTEFSLDS